MLTLLCVTAKQYVSEHETYEPKTNNCMTFVDEVAKDLS